MDKDILTTAETARLLGISVRTAQLLIEQGALTTWKTPGGHRRVHRADVMALMAQKRTAPPAAHSARVVVVSTAERLPALTRRLATVGGCSVEAHASAYAASFSIGSRAPAVVIVDVADGTSGRTSFLQSIASNPTLAQIKLIAIGDAADAAAIASSRLHAHLRDPDGVVDAVRSALRDPSAPAVLFAGTPSFPLADNENQRLAALERSGLLKTGSEQTFDDLTWLASLHLKAPIALMTLLTSTHQVFKSRQGLDMMETPRSWAFCNHTVLQRDVFSVGDLSGDTRFASNPAVMGGPHFRFYAGAPVIDPDGFALGSVCVIDYAPRRLDADQEQALRVLARCASREVRLQAMTSR